MTARADFRQPESPKRRLVFCAGAPNPNLVILNQGYDLLVGVDGGARILAQAGYVPDWAIGDFDSASPPDCQRVLRLPCAKNDTDLEAALCHVLSNYAVDEIGEIVILGALGGGRLDHLLCNLFLVHQPRFAAYWDKFRFVERGNSLRFYGSGCHQIAREVDKHYLSFVGLTALRGLSLYDVQYPLRQANYDYPIALISNEFLSNFMTFELAEGILAAIQSTDKFE